MRAIQTKSEGNSHVHRRKINPTMLEKKKDNSLTRKISFFFSWMQVLVKNQVFVKREGNSYHYDVTMAWANVSLTCNEGNSYVRWGQFPLEWGQFTPQNWIFWKPGHLHIAVYLRKQRAPSICHVYDSLLSSWRLFAEIFQADTWEIRIAVKTQLLCIYRTKDQLL